MPMIPGHSYDRSYLDEQKLYAVTYLCWIHADRKLLKFADTWHITSTCIGEANRIACEFFDKNVDERAWDSYEVTGIHVVR